MQTTRVLDVKPPHYISSYCAGKPLGRSSRAHTGAKIYRSLDAGLFAWRCPRVVYRYIVVKMV